MAKTQWQPSGRLGPRAALLPVVALALGAGVGVAYSLVGVLLPLKGLLSLGMLFVSTQVLANGNTWAAEWAHVRNRWFVVGTAALAGLAALYAGWVTFALGLGAGEIGLSTAMNPTFLLRFVSLLGESGWYESWSITPKGDMLWTMWAVEAGALVGLPIQGALSYPNRAYCERCGTWASHLRTLLTFGENAKADVQGAIERMDLAALAAMEPETPACDAVHVVNLYGCASCGELRTISLGKVLRAMPGQERSVLALPQSAELVRQRLVTADQVAALESLAEAMREIQRTRDGASSASGTRLPR